MLGFISREHFSLLSRPLTRAEHLRREKIVHKAPEDEKTPTTPALPALSEGSGQAAVGAAVGLTVYLASLGRTVPLSKDRNSL